MKKRYFLVLILALSLFLQSCLGILGGNNLRELGEYTAFFSDGDKKYLKYHYYQYMEFDGDSFKLCDSKSINADNLSELNSDSEVLLCAYVTVWEDIVVKEGYEYLSDQLREKIDDCEDFEAIILKKGEYIYGAVNCYNRSAGRSGNLLANEDLKKSYLLEVEDKNIILVEPLEKAAVLAVNQSHYLAYVNKKFYSVDKESGAKIEICKDIWWDDGPTFYDNVDVSFVDDVFVIYANRSGLVTPTYETLIVGNINGENIQILIDDEKMVFD